MEVGGQGGTGPLSSFERGGGGGVRGGTELNYTLRSVRYRLIHTLFRVNESNNEYCHVAKYSQRQSGHH